MTNKLLGPSLLSPMQPEEIESIKKLSSILSKAVLLLSKDSPNTIECLELLRVNTGYLLTDYGASQASFTSALAINRHYGLSLPESLSRRIRYPDRHLMSSIWEESSPLAIMDSDDLGYLRSASARSLLLKPAHLGTSTLLKFSLSSGVTFEIRDPYKLRDLLYMHRSKIVLKGGSRSRVGRLFESDMSWQKAVQETFAPHFPVLLQEYHQPALVLVQGGESQSAYCMLRIFVTMKEFFGIAYYETPDGCRWEIPLVL